MVGRAVGGLAIAVSLAACSPPCLDDGLGQSIDEHCDGFDSSTGTSGESSGSTGSTSDDGPTSADVTSSDGGSSSEGTTTGSSTDGSSSEGSSTESSSSEGSSSDGSSSDGSSSEGSTSEGTTTTDATTTDATTTDATSSGDDTSGSSDGSSSSSDGPGTTQWCADDDLDGFGDPLDCVDVVDGDVPPPGFVPDATDCDDADPAVHLGCVGCLPLAPACTAGDELGVCNVNGTFVFPVSDCEFGCDEATATCWPELEVTIAPACHAVAQGAGTVLDATAIGGDGVYTFAWTPAASLDDATLEDPTASPSAITEYTVTVTDATGNTAQASTTVHVEDVAWDLSACELFTFDPTAVTDASQPDHVFDNGNTEMCNVAESVPSARVCPWIVEGFHIEGDFVVDTDEDGDGIGFVWGWQDDHHFYVLSWKQDDDAAAFGGWPMGLIVKRIHADSGGVTAEDLFLPSDTPNSTLLVGPGDVGVGWVDFEAYTITIDHAFPTTTIEVRRAADDSVVFGGPIVDFSYPRGRFGPFDASQIAACSGPWTSGCF